MQIDRVCLESLKLSGNLKDLGLYGIIIIININLKLYWEGILHDHHSLLCCPDAPNLLGDPLSGNGCGSPNHRWF